MSSLKLPLAETGDASLPHGGQDTESDEFLREVCVEFPLNFCYEDGRFASERKNVIYRSQSMRATRKLKRRPA
jgi:hypothetical protein